MSDIKLSLQAPEENGEQSGPQFTPPPEQEPTPVAGYLAVGLGLLGIFTMGYIFVPLALLASVIALFSGQVIWGVFGILLTFAGLLTSPILLTFLGLAWMASFVGL